MAIGAILSAAVAAAGLGLQANAQANENAINWRNVFRQERDSNERSRMAKASRTDAYGNEVRYVPGEGWKTITTPTTKAILDSQQREQLAQFRDDAPRNRQLANRIAERANKASDAFDEVFDDYKYRRKKSEQEYIAEAIRDAIAARRGGGASRGAVGDLSRMALRTGNTGALPELLKIAKANNTGGTLAEAIAAAKKAGKQQYLVENNADMQSFFGELGQLRAIADQIPSTQMNWNNENAALTGQQNDANKTLIQTNLQNSGAMDSALSRAAASAGKFPDVGPLAAALGKINFKGQPKKSADEQLLEELLIQQQIGGARIGIANNDAILADMFKGNTGNF